MSSNKTIIPGMEEAYKESTPNFSTPSPKVPDGTHIPNPFGTAPVAAPDRTNQKPVVGFLYSISRTSAGEYWPLRIGSNSIGRSQDCDICLNEATVSDQHAVLVVRQMKNPEKIIASVCDARSTCGTMINGESLGFDQRECFNGDIITIGEHYDLYFVLIDAKQIGLNVCREFMATNSASQSLNRMSQQQPANNPYAAPAYNTGTLGYEQGGFGAQNGTVGFEPEDSKPSSKPGGTIFM